MIAVEGLDLGAVEPSRYGLICLPLKIVGALSNPRLQVELQKLGRLDANLSEAIRRDPGLHRRQGTVLDAVTTVLEQTRTPLHVKEIHAAVEELLNAPVQASSVRQALSSHAQAGDLRFRRLRHGLYEHR